MGHDKARYLNYSNMYWQIYFTSSHENVDSNKLSNLQTLSGMFQISQWSLTGSGSVVVIMRRHWVKMTPSKLDKNKIQVQTQEGKWGEIYCGILEGNSW